MRYLLIFQPEHGAKAKAFAAPLRHRRHHVLLQDIPAAAAYPAREAVDSLIIMLEGDAPHGLDVVKALYDDLPVISIAPDEAPWEPTKDELETMKPLNKLRHDAALLGIEIDPAYDEPTLAALISNAQGKEAAKDAKDEAEAQAAAAAIEKAAKERESGAPQAPASPQTDAEREAVDKANAAEAAKLIAEEEAKLAALANQNAEVIAEIKAEAKVVDEKIAKLNDRLAGLDVNDAVALREFAKANNIPVSPNKKTSAAKLLAAIKAGLEIEESANG